MTSDFEEDACDLLDQSEASYFVVVCVPDSVGIRIHSNLGGNAKQVRQMIEAGELQYQMTRHLKTNYPRE